MFDSFRRCPSLKAAERCFVTRRYVDGDFLQEDHLHIPKHRMSLKSARSALQSMILAKITQDAEQLSQFFLNNRKGGPAARILRTEISYPEPGVLRTIMGGNIQGWFDEVISKNEFRTEEHTNAN